MKRILFTLTVFLLTSVAFFTTAYGTTIRVGLTRSFYNQNSISISNTSIAIGRGMADGTFVYNRTLTSSNGFTFRSEGGQVVVSAGGQSVFTFVRDVEGAPQIRPSSGGRMTMGNSSYRGIIEFRASGGSITAINVICIEEYLYSVVPVEMSPSFTTEALRAQAVASRTFAAYRANRRHYRARGFDICDRTCCQSYLGAGRENDITTQAVRDTRGLMIFVYGYEAPAFTPFSSSSGGATDSSENVWGGVLSHLQGVPDPYEQDGRVWTRTFTWAQLSQVPTTNIGSVTGITLSKSSLGRVQEVTFIGTNGQWSVRSQQILSAFGRAGGSLYSRNFQISGSADTGSGTALHITDGENTHQAPITTLQAINRLGSVRPVTATYIFDGVNIRQLERVTSVSGGTGITINGRGWGHGVGMSQFGANGMAQAGYNFKEILQHYYTGVEIRQIWELAENYEY